MWLIIIMSTIPTLQPLFVKLFRSVRELSTKQSRTSRASYGRDTKSSTLKEHSGSVQLQSVGGSKAEGSSRLSHKGIGGSESVEDILPKGDRIIVRSDYDVAYEEHANPHMQDVV